MKKVEKFKNVKVKSLIFIIFGVVLLTCVGFLIYKGFCNQSSVEEQVPFIKELNNKVVVENQLALPQKGDLVAIFNVKDYGVFKCRLFKEAMPNTVNNFVKLVNAKKYDGLTFDDIIPDLKIQCGDEADGVSDFKPKEYNASLHSYNGALCAVCPDESNVQTGQFYIVFSEAGRQADFDYLENSYSEDSENGIAKFDDGVRSNYKERGGFPAYDLMGASVFGQVYEGIDVVEKMMNCPKNYDNLLDEPLPVNSIVIEKVEMLTI